MADEPKKKGDEKRVQFSISMKPKVKIQLDKLAGLRQITTSLLIERICEEKLGTIDEQTWNLIETLQSRLDIGAEVVPATKTKRGK